MKYILITALLMGACVSVKDRLSSDLINQQCLEIARMRFADEKLVIFEVKDDECFISVSPNTDVGRPALSPRLVNERILKVNYVTKDLAIMPRR